MLDLLTHKIVSGVANAAVSVPVVGGVFGADDTGASDSDVSDFAEAAFLVEVLVPSAGGRGVGVAGFCDWVVLLVHGALDALARGDVCDYVGGDVCTLGYGDDSEVAVGADAGLLVGVVYLIENALDEDAVAV